MENGIVFGDGDRLAEIRGALPEAEMRQRVADRAIRISHVFSEDSVLDKLPAVDGAAVNRGETRDIPQMPVDAMELREPLRAAIEIDEKDLQGLVPLCAPS